MGHEGGREILKGNVWEIRQSAGVQGIKEKIKVIYTSHSPQISYHPLSPTFYVSPRSLPTTEKLGIGKPGQK